MNTPLVRSFITEYFEALHGVDAIDDPAAIDCRNNSADSANEASARNMLMTLDHLFAVSSPAYEKNAPITPATRKNAATIMNRVRCVTVYLSSPADLVDF